MSEEANKVMAKYFDATETFRRSATEFIRHVNYLPEALDAYQRADTASAELRNALDANDENLRTIMAQLQNALELIQVGVAALDKKKQPEPVRIDVMKMGGGHV